MGGTGMSDEITKSGGLLPALPITEEVPLDGMGYDEGSHAVIIINPPRAYFKAQAEIARDVRKVATELAEAMVEGPDKDPALAGLEQEAEERSQEYLRLLGMVVSHVVLISGDNRLEYGSAYEGLTLDEVVSLDDMEPSLFNFLNIEMDERRRARLDKMRATFRADRAEEERHAATGTKGHERQANGASPGARNVPDEETVAQKLKQYNVLSSKSD